MEAMELMEAMKVMAWLLSRGAQVSVLLLPAAGLLSSQARSHILGVTITGHCDNTDVAPTPLPALHSPQQMQIFKQKQCLALTGGSIPG